MWKCCSCFAKTYEAPEVLELDYRHSSLSQVPADVFTFERTLERLDLGSNQISDLPPSLFHCHELKELDLCDNDLMAIPPAVGSLTRLCKLDLSRNAITDIADTIKNCKSLVYFDLSMNHLTKLPEGISQLVNLEELFLNDTYLEFLHANFGRLTKLKVLELRENAIQTLPKSMSRLHNLQRLDIGQNDMAELPEVIGTMTNLTELWCDNNSIRSIPKFIGNLTKLNCLDASQNEIQGIAEEICKCSQLNDVTLNMNSLEVLPDSFTKLEQLAVLRLDSNSLSYLPEQFGNLKNLQELSLVGNILKSLPSSFGLLRKLHTLYLDDNLLTSLPKEIGSCTSLSVLSAAKNRLKEIPSEVGHLNNLKVFTLSGNLLVNLPVSILNISKLGALWLSESQSKPLLQMNKEIDPVSGQHVLTCYLLPQLPSTGESGGKKYPEDSKENAVPRRNKPSIKFTDEEAVVVEPSVNKRGLLRAPTPYPKELRALAKHASHLRQSKEHNGEIPNTDEPEYEGDYLEENGKVGDNPPLALAQPASVHKYSESMAHAKSEVGAGPSYSGYNPNLLGSGSSSKVDYKSPLPVNSSIETIGLPSVPPAMSNKSSITSATALAKASFFQQHLVEPGYPEDNTGLSQHVATNVGAISDHEKVGREAFGASATEFARKTPPPYHVAARRAAFFRSSGGAGSGKIGAGATDQAQSSPLIGRVFPLPLPISSSVASSSVSSSSAVSSPVSITAPASVQVDNGGSKSPVEDDIEDELDIPSMSILNKTYTISSKDVGVEETSDHVTSSMEENLDRESGLASPIVMDSNSLVKTIESALEGVDKRTTEFLREDRWEQDDPAELPPPPPPPPHEEGNLYANVEFNQRNADHSFDHMDATRSRPNFPSLQHSPPGFEVSNKGPAVPPKPSPKLGRPPASSSDSSQPSSLNSSFRGESRIPTFSPSQKFTTVHSKPVQRAGPASPAPSGSSYDLGVEGRASPGPTSPPSLSSRIPKLPSLTSSFTSPPSGSFLPHNQSKKPDVLSPKPALLTKSLLPSRTPSSPDQCDQKEVNNSRSSGLPTPKFSTGDNSMNNGVNSNHKGNLNNVPATASTSKIPRLGDQMEPELKRMGSGSRIPKINDVSSRSNTSQSVDNATASIDNNNDDEDELSSMPSSVGISRIPSLGKKPWIFGTHRNARVVAVEFRKMNELGFVISDAPPPGHSVDGQGIYVIETDSSDSTVKIGDKVLQVDGIDVSNMGLEIVKKILSNCQENINLLVSRHS